MQKSTALFGPIVEVRDVLESFLRDQVLVADWRGKLAQASRQFIDIGAHPADGDLVGLGQRIAVLAESELATQRTLTRSVAADIETLMDRVHIPDLPRPEDENWGF